MLEAGYTIIIHPGEEGVTIHEEGMVTVTTNKPPVLQRCKSNKAKLWTVLTAQDTTKEGIHNVYSLPSIKQSIRYLHAAASYPAKETWIKAITTGNCITWPGLTAEAVRKHFPKSDETQRGHMKRQCQGVRSTKERKEEEHQDASTTKEHSEKNSKTYSQKIHNASETMHTDQCGRFPTTSARGNQ